MFVPSSAISVNTSRIFETEKQSAYPEAINAAKTLLTGKNVGLEKTS